MMSNAGYQDRILTCRDCGQDFIFTAGEQEFYASRGLTNDPGRCSACRAARRNGQSSSPRARSYSGEHYETTCATCGRPTSVPFVPSEGRPVYCSDCFQAQRASRGPRRDDSRNYNSYGNNYGGSSYGGTSGTSGNSYNSYGSGRSDRGGRDRDRDRRDYRDRRDNRDRW